MNLTLSAMQILNLVLKNGDLKTYIVEGGIGCGKSSLIKMAEETCGPAFNYVTVDCTQWDVGDVQVPDVDKAAQCVRFLPNVLLVGDGAKPMFILLDEIGKASRAVQNALLPVLLERRVGAVPLPPGSIVLGATNLGGEGVGDLFQAHARNRVSFIEMRYPTADEWVEWAVAHDVPAPVLVWAKETEQLFQSFKDVDNPADNPYIFHPREQRRSFVTPRSLYLAAIELQDGRRVDDQDATLAAIAGNIGARAALDLMAFVKLADKLPSMSLVLAEPDTAPVPVQSAAVLMVFRLVAKATTETMDAIITYMQRMPKELQALFATHIMRNRKTQQFAATNRAFTVWTASNHWMVR